YQRDLLTRLDEADEALRAAEEKQATMQAIADRASGYTPMLGP
ncbi:hypothetical protein A2U01_0071510, partial [Trifolium medium]|nr:hypothetical protein [Trifolium medium]